MQIISEIRGGLGNQLFQYAAGINLSHHFSAEFYLDLKHFSLARQIARLRTTTPRTFQLAKLGLPLQKLSDQPFVRLERSAATGTVREFSGGKPLLEEIVRDTDSWADIQAKSSELDSIRLNGHWQRTEIVEPVLDIIRGGINGELLVSERNRPLLDLVSDPGTLTMHVRRGDICRDPWRGKIHGCLAVEYFHSAICAVRSEREIGQLVVVSDDVRWCRKNLSVGVPTSFVSAIRRSPTSDLFIASHARQFVMSNSTLSWWAAALNSAWNPLILCPKLWSPGVTAKEKGLFHPKWRLHASEPFFSS